MGNKQSAYTETIQLDSRGSDFSNLDCFMIEPVPEGLEHVVYPKYEEAFRLGVQAFMTPVRVNKFKRPLPHVLSNMEFQKQNDEEIPLASKISTHSSGLSTTSKSPFSRPPVAPERTNTEPMDDNDYIHSKTVGGIFALNDEQNSPEDEESFEIETHFSISEDDVTVVSHLSQDHEQQTTGSSDDERSSQCSQSTLDPSSSFNQLKGDLFEADLMYLTALEAYRQNGMSSKKFRSISEKQMLIPEENSVSTVRRHQSSKSVRSQMTQDLMKLGKNLSDLQTQRVL
eukprot:g7233.t1